MDNACLSGAKSLPAELAKRLRPYANTPLSAFDNLKLLKALAQQAGVDCGCWELARSTSQSPRNFYALRWQEVWLDCGWSNDYSAQIVVMSAPSGEQFAVARAVEVPLLNAQQLSFMCMQYAHFDHC